MKFIPVNEPLLSGNEKKYLNECIDSGWISSEGPFVERFEKAFASAVGRGHGVAVCNGSAALEVAVAALNIGPGDEVILPTFTIISCLAPIIRSGATPIFVDSNAETWNMDVDQVIQCIGPRTKAIMAVHLYGLPVDMDPILDAAKKRDIPVIEDAAQAIGLNYKGRPCGSMGTISVFSFYPNKHVTTGEGGMVLCNDKDMADHCRSLRNLCFQPQQRFVHDELGWNFRMTNLQAAVGLAQLERLNSSIERKRIIGARYQEILADVTCLQLPVRKTDFAENIYWVFGVVLDREVRFDAKEAMNRLNAKRIGTRPFFWPLHQQPVLEKLGMITKQRFPIAENLARRGFYLPSGIALNSEHIHSASIALREIVA